MAENRKQSPHYIPELDPENFDSSEGWASAARLQLLQVTIAGFFIGAFGFVAERETPQYIGGVLFVIGLLGFVLGTVRGRKVRGEK